MNANSRSPWAAWLRFMKSMSMSAHGRSRLYCVWRWTSGLRRSVSPPIHILAGEKVCIHATTPMHDGLASASCRTAAIASAVVTTGLATILTGTSAASSRQRAMCRAFSSTRSRTVSPYRCWLPVTNHASRSRSARFIPSRPRT